MDLLTRNNTVTQEQIDRLWETAKVEVTTAYDKCTVMTVKLENGFILSASSACVDPANYDPELGAQICRRKIEDKLWELEGYCLQKQLFEERAAAQKGMTAEREGAILEAAIETWGERAQIGIAIEEMSELTKALCKYLRFQNGDLDCDAAALLRCAVLEEMADVGIMLNQMALIFGDPTEQEIYKLERLEQRINRDKKGEE